nr:immunoglobulin light chain junction region [Macaca mulatta]MOW07971.1 immunoglobulin light chain junction region [Macaca mulatta]MOW08095.1 immunoglobulin light chain junction region [Macaca mulatta]MOW08147.1 immunoglobulin light chain junction region [Macaca mulatta]MOW08199.1 immunoglobulin light chain junction region [Macaca mulatta]
CMQGLEFPMYSF